MFKYQKIGEMDSEYPFLFCSKSDFWMEIPDDKVNSFENTKRQTPKMTFVFVLKRLSLLNRFYLVARYLEFLLERLLLVDETVWSCIGNPLPILEDWSFGLG